MNCGLMAGKSIYQNHWDHDWAVSRCAKSQSRSAARSSRPPPGGPVGRSRPALAPGEPPHRRHSPAQTSSNCVNCGWAETCEGNGDFLSANWGANLPRSSLLGIPSKKPPGKSQRLLNRCEIKLCPFLSNMFFSIFVLCFFPRCNNALFVSLGLS